MTKLVLNFSTAFDGKRPLSRDKAFRIDSNGHIEQLQLKDQVPSAEPTVLITATRGLTAAQFCARLARIAAAVMAGEEFIELEDPAK